MTSTILVTGATDGIGKAAAIRLAAAGHNVILHGRNPDKLAAAYDTVSANAAGNVGKVLADFASLRSVSELAAVVSRDFPALNVLVNNAGHLTDHRQESDDSFELTFAVNFLAPFLLTNLLLPTLRENPPARIVNVASTAMGGGQINFGDLQMKQGFDGWQAYANSKLANVLFSNLLAERIAGSGVVSNSCCPGLIDTNFFHTNTVFANGMYERMRPGMRPPEQGADIPVFMASSQDAAELNGRFFLRRPDLGLGDDVQSMAINWDRSVAERLWETGIQLVSPWLPG